MTAETRFGIAFATTLSLIIAILGSRFVWGPILHALITAQG